MRLSIASRCCWRSSGGRGMRRARPRWVGVCGVGLVGVGWVGGFGLGWGGVGGRIGWWGWVVGLVCWDKSIREGG